MTLLHDFIVHSTMSSPGIREIRVVAIATGLLG
jgi:hypothetical protein